MAELFALAVLMVWALVLLFWIPVHRFRHFFRRLGLATYVTPIVTWLPAAALIYLFRSEILAVRLSLPAFVSLAGWTIFSLGFALQFWTLRLLGGLRIMGVAEVTTLIENRIITAGPFSVVRHPTYVSHTVMFAGAFLITGYAALAIITVLDLFLVNLLLIPLEDSELVERLGPEYRRYMETTPAYFPKRPAGE